MLPNARGVDASDLADGGTDRPRRVPRRALLCRAASAALPLLALSACGGTATSTASGSATSARAAVTSAPVVAASTSASSTTASATSALSATSVAAATTSNSAASTASSTAAASAATSSATATTSAKPIPPGALRIAYWRSLAGPRGAAQDKLAQDFNDSQTAIHVDVTYAGSYDPAAQKFTAALAGGTAPDCILLTVDSYMPGFARADALLPLDAYAALKKPIDTSLFVPTLLNNGIVDGKLYQLPLARSTPLLYYNQDALTEVGLSDPPKTWTEFRTMSPKLVQQAGSAQGRVGYVVSPYWWTFASVLWSFGGRFSDDNFNVMIDQPEAVAAMTLWSDLVNKDRSAIYGSTDTADKDFTTAKAAFLTDSTADLSEWQQESHFTVKAAFMPAEKASGVPSGGSGLSIVKPAPKNRQDAAWTFMSYMTSKSSSIYFAEQTGYEPTRSDALTDPEMVSYFAKNPEFKVSVDQMANIHNQDPVTQLPQSIDFIQNGIKAVVSDKQSAQDALRQVAQQLRNLVDQFHQQQKR